MQEYTAKQAKETMGQRIRTLREHLGLTRQEMAGRLSVPVAHLEQIEAGSYLPSGVFVGLLCGEYEVSREWLFYGNGSPFPQEPQEVEPVIRGCRATAEDVAQFKRTPILTGLFDLCEEQTDHDRVEATQMAQDSLNSFLEENKGMHLTQERMMDLGDRVYALTNQEYEAGYRYGARDMVKLLLEALSIGDGEAGPADKLRALAKQAENRLAHENSRPA